MRRMAAPDAPASPHVVVRWAKGFVDLCGLKFQYRPWTHHRTQSHLRPFFFAERIVWRKDLSEEGTSSGQAKRFLSAVFIL